MSAENKYDKFERDLLNATAAKKPKDETEVEKTVDDLLKNTLAGMGIDPEKKKQILKEADEQAKVEPAKPAPPPPKSDVFGLRPAEKPEKKEPEKAIKAESPPWAKEMPRPTTFVPPPKHEPPPPAHKEHKEKAEMPFPSLKKDGVFLEDYGKEKKKSKPLVPILVGGLVVVIAVVGVLILSGGKQKPPVSGKNTATEAKPLETVPGPAEAVTGSTTLASNPTGTPDTKTAVDSTGQKVPAARSASNKAEPAPVLDKKKPAETQPAGPAGDSSTAPLMPADATTTKVQEIKPTRTAPADQTRTPETSQPAKPKIILGQLVPMAEVNTPPVLVKKVDPLYPPMAQRMGIQGAVKLNALIDETGSVVRTEVLQAASAGAVYGFERASQDAVMKWKYKPAVKEGTYVKVWMPVQVSFNIKK